MDVVVCETSRGGEFGSRIGRHYKVLSSFNSEQQEWFSNYVNLIDLARSKAV